VGYEVEKRKIIASATLIIMLMASLTVLIPSVSASAQNQIILPFHTSWENQQPIGRSNSIDFKKDFYGYNGPSYPLQPELGMRNNEIAPPSNVFGYDFGSRQLMGAGYFGASYSYAYFNLFDQTTDSDYGPPFKIMPQTFINLWYYHYRLANCMIDAEIYNARTEQYSALRDFYNGGYIVDQNGKRLHPAFRSDDPIGSWQFVSFDLSKIYQQDPENWYVTKIWIGFDNGGNGQTGQCRTYFDMLHISYGVGMHGGQRGYSTGAAVAWDKHMTPDGKYNLWLKIGIVGDKHDRQYGYFELTGYPNQLEVTVDYPNVQALASPKPTGVNLTQPDPNTPRVLEFTYDVLKTIVGFLTKGITDAVFLGLEFTELLSTPAPQPTYTFPLTQWLPPPNADIGPDRAAGEVYVLISGIPAGTTINIPIKFKIVYYTWAHGYWNMDEFTLYLSWSSVPTNPPPVSLSISASSGGTTDPASGTYTYDYGSSVAVTAFAYSGYTFSHWLLDGATVYDNPITVTMDSDHTLKAYFNRADDFFDGTFEGWSWSGGHLDTYGGVGILWIHKNSSAVMTKSLTFNSAVLEFVTVRCTYLWEGVAWRFIARRASDGTWLYGPLISDAETKTWVITDWYTGEIDKIGIKIYGEDGDYAQFDYIAITNNVALTIVAGSGGTTNPSPGTYEYSQKTSVQATATPDTDYYFRYWSLDGQIIGYAQTITVTIDANHTLKAHFIHPSGTGCPALLAWNGTDYVNYGVINIHDIENDAIREVSVSTEDVSLAGYKAKFKLREGWEGLNYSHSLIDQVKLYAVDSNGNLYLCPLIQAQHNEQGNVLLQLLLSDNYRTDTYLMQTIDLTFIVPYPQQMIVNFVFVIEGHNPLKT